MKNAIRSIALAAALLPNASHAGPDVTIANVPLPVTGNLNATVSGTVNANVTNAVLPITGLVGVSSLPAVNVSSLPAVSLTVPANPFYGAINLTVSAVAKAIGVGGQRLAVTSITISNFNATTQQLFLFNPVMSGGSCGGSVVGGAAPSTTLLLEPFKTMQLQFPTPRIYDLDSSGCLAAEVTTVMAGGSVLVDVVGFTTP